MDDVPKRVRPDHAYIIDTETASLQGGVVELAWLKVDAELNVVDSMCSRCNPERPIDPGAQAIHGISDADVANMPTLGILAASFTEPIYFIAHNASFDKRMLKGHIEADKTLCSLALSRQFIKGTTNNKLATLQAELNLPPQPSHTALGDVLTVRDLLLHLLPLTGVDLWTLFDRAAAPRILNVMPWGKHKDVPMLRVPREYRAWLSSLTDLDSDLAYTIEKIKNL